jgi:two-component system sensor histidine kinase QseC
LNHLFERIAGLLAGERRFTADAAHELRTPIAAIRAQAQVALGATEPAERSHALQATLQGCDRATHLVQQLLTLSRLEAQDGVSGSVLDLAVLAQRVAAELALAAVQREQTLWLDAPAACPVQGDEALLGVLLRNLIDNAMRYSPPGATIALSVRTSASGPELWVEDSGPGLSEADLARLGERFFRVLGNGADGSGLGWSIVRRVASAHRAQLHASRSPALGGLRVRLCLAPLQPGPSAEVSSQGPGARSESPSGAGGMSGTR